MPAKVSVSLCLAWCYLVGAPWLITACAGPEDAWEWPRCESGMTATITRTVAAQQKFQGTPKPAATCWLP